jgi:predicted nucleic-acid-binding Zn-ribbon protein
MSEEKIEKLKPCMFCETTEEVIEKEIDGPVYLEIAEFNNGEYWYVECHNCGARGPQGMSRKIAARKWNRRKQ